MRRGLVGDDVRGDAARDQFGVDVGGVAAEADGQRLAAGAGSVNQRQRFIERRRFLLQIAVFQTLGDARRVGFNDEYRRARHHACERLRAAHAAEAGGQNEFTGERIVEMLAGNLHENLKRALNDALRADVLPGAGGQPAPADEAFVLQVVEDFRLRPLPDHIAVRHDDQRRVHVRFHHANRLAGLNQQGFVFRHRLQRRDNRVVARPVARGAAEGGVNNQLVRIFANGEDVFQKTQQRFLPPATATQRAAGSYLIVLFHDFLPFFLRAGWARA